MVIMVEHATDAGLTSTNELGASLSNRRFYSHFARYCKNGLKCRNILNASTYVKKATHALVKKYTSAHVYASCRSD